MLKALIHSTPFSVSENKKNHAFSFWKKKTLAFSYSLSGFRTGVARQTLRVLAIFDGLHRTAADAGHAMRAVTGCPASNLIFFNGHS